MENYIGEIRLFAGNFAPVGWALCDGSILSIQDHEGLFSIIKNVYGGDGVNNFSLPDLRGRIPVGVGQGTEIGFGLGSQIGFERVAIGIENMPSHTHALQSDIKAKYSPLCNDSTSQAIDDPTNAVFGGTPASNNMYSDTANASMKAAVENITATMTIGHSGEGTSHSNIQPVTVLNYIIAIHGIIPR